MIPCKPISDAYLILWHQATLCSKSYVTFLTYILKKLWSLEKAAIWAIDHYIDYIFVAFLKLFKGN